MQGVNFNVSKQSIGTYKVTIDQLSETFEVIPTPPNFVLSNLSINPNEVHPGETVTISVTVTNTGGRGSSHDVSLNIDGAREEIKRSTFGAGSSGVVTFQLTKQEVGTYLVTIGNLSGSFVVVPLPPHLEIVSVVPNPIGPGYYATLTVKTEPGAFCTATVIYSSGEGDPAGLRPDKIANSSGYVSWTWKVGTRTTAGTWDIIVTATHNGVTVEQTTTITVLP